LALFGFWFTVFPSPSEGRGNAQKHIFVLMFFIFSFVFDWKTG
jgi:hypothetical protein